MTNLACLLIAMALALAPGAALASDARGRSDAPLRNTALTLNPLALLAGAADLQLEMRRTPGTALAFRAGFGPDSRADWMWGTLGLGLAWRMYPDRNALRGFYWGPGAALALAAPRREGAAIGPTIEAGAQIVVDGGFALGLGGGLAWYFGSGAAVPTGRLEPFARIALGYAWR